MKKFITLTSPSPNENNKIVVNVDNITTMFPMTTLTFIGLSGDKHVEVNESVDEIMNMIDNIDSELPVGEFTGGDPIDDEDDSDTSEIITTYDIRTGEPIRRPVAPYEAQPGTRFRFGELTETERGLPLLELVYTNSKGVEVSQYIGPFRCYDFSIGPKSDIGSGGNSSGIIEMRKIDLHKNYRKSFLNMMASEAILRWCASYGVIPNPGIRLGWHDNVYHAFIDKCVVYVYGDGDGE